MQILSRFLIVVVLLGSLAYGSYAFGKYVLSAHLLNESPVKRDADEAVKRSTRAAEAVTRQTDYKGTQPKVELKVLPAGADGEGPAAPPRRSLVRHTEEERSAERDTKPSVAESDAAAERAVEREAQRAEELLSGADKPIRSDSESRNRSTGEDSSTRSTRSSRREDDEKRREARRIEKNPFADLGTPETRPDANSPVSGGGVYRGGEDGEAPRKRRRRKKPTPETPNTATTTSGSNSGSMVPVPEADAPRPTRSTPRATVITDSPVPRPEGGGGSESPVPQPE